MVKKIPCSVLDEYVKGAGVSIGAKGSSDDTALALTFSPQWEGTTKTLVWVDARGIYASTQVLTAQMLEDGVYVVPITAEAKAYEGVARMSIKGSIILDGGIEQTTISASAEFVVLPSVWDYDESEDVTPTIAEQLQAEIDDILDDIQAAVAAGEEAKGYAESAYDSETSAAGSAQDAHDFSVSAGLSATDASISAVAAESWAVGGTNTRAGEDTNNAKYWCEQAEEAVGGDFVTHTEFNAHTGDYDNPHHVDKADVGLGNVDNTADSLKPVSEAQQIAINTAVSNLQGNTSSTVAAVESAKANKSVASQVTLTSAGWTTSGDKVVQTAFVTGLLANSNVVISPDPASWDAFKENNIFCSAQAAGSLTFTADEAPSASVTANVLIVG